MRKSESKKSLNNIIIKTKKINVSLLTLIIIVLSSTLIFYFIGFNSKNCNNNLEIQSEETVEFDIVGEYTVGKDINPGTYYVVLTEIDKNDENTYIITSKTKMMNFVGEKEKIELENGSKFIINDGYDPKYWTLSFFNKGDYEEYSKKNKIVNSRKKTVLEKNIDPKKDEKIEKENKKRNDLNYLKVMKNPKKYKYKQFQFVMSVEDIYHDTESSAVRGFIDGDTKKPVSILFIDYSTKLPEKETYIDIKASFTDVYKVSTSGLGAYDFDGLNEGTKILFFHMEEYN